MREDGAYGNSKTVFNGSTGAGGAAGAGAAGRAWLAVSDLHRDLITCKALPAGADLREILRAALEQCAAEGCQAENDGAYGFPFIARGSERRLVNLTPVDPSDCAGSGHAFLAGRGVVDQAVEMQKGR